MLIWMEIISEKVVKCLPGYGSVSFLNTVLELKHNENIDTNLALTETSLNTAWQNCLAQLFCPISIHSLPLLKKLIRIVV